MATVFCCQYPASGVIMTGSPVCGASITSPEPIYIPTCRGFVAVPSLPALPDTRTSYAHLSAIPGTAQAAGLGWQEMTP